MLSSVEYLGYKISEMSLQPTDEKRSLLSKYQECISTQNISKFWSFLGLTNYIIAHLYLIYHMLSPSVQAATENNTVILGTKTTEML